ncbi:MAG: AI-2E family transporter, partial [Bacteroidales bacterium]|nr:AI-2E family transporter [Bacteroidales bacterium]
GVSLLNVLGLLLVARMGFRYSLGIAALTGVLNIVPYVGPLIGGVIGVCLSLLIKYVCASSFGLAVGFPAFLAVLLGVFIFTQLIDNYVFQPLIYSSSIKAHPLEIFIVLLLAASMGGIIGMLVAIPAYTVIRVFAVKFFGETKVLRKLTQSED